MGMFDTVWCDWPLPAPEAQHFQFQTKDLACGLDEYRITAAGRLVEYIWDYEDVPAAELPVPAHPWVGCVRRVPGSERQIDQDYHGDLNFYGSAQTGDVFAFNLRTGEDVLHPGPAPEWYEFVARFTDGQVQSIRRLAVVS